MILLTYPGLASFPPRFIPLSARSEKRRYRPAITFPRVAPPRPRSFTPVSVRIRWTNPYDLPVASASARMDSPESYRFFRSVANLLRSAPVTRVPFLRVSATCTSREVEHSLRNTPLSQ
jgi:hypothetical protein